VLVQTLQSGVQRCFCVFAQEAARSRRGQYTSVATRCVPQQHPERALQTSRHATTTNEASRHMLSQSFTNQRNCVRNAAMSRLLHFGEQSMELQQPSKFANYACIELHTFMWSIAALWQPWRVCYIRKLPQHAALVVQTPLDLSNARNAADAGQASSLGQDSSHFCRSSGSLLRYFMRLFS
jgi:hypothetical protein